MSGEFTRRSFVRGASVVSLAALAGCSTGDGGSGSNGNAPSEVSEWLSNTSNFDGDLTDLTGESSVTVKVGAEGNGAYYAFEPAAVKISTGTTITWEWTGKGSLHNVVEQDGAFDSGQPQQTGTFEHAFSEAGTFLYLCEPHETQGMKGAVVVE